LKKVTLILLINFVLVSNVFSYTVITDPNVFYVFFEKPAKVIDFTELKDGTSYNNISGRVEPDTFKVSEPDCKDTRAGDLKALTVGPGAFSNAWFFQGTDPVQVHSFCDTILWFDQAFVIRSCGLIKEYQQVTTVWLCQQTLSDHNLLRCTPIKDLWVLFRILPKKLFLYLRTFTLYSVLKRSFQRRPLSLNRRSHSWPKLK